MASLRPAVPCPAAPRLAPRLAPHPLSPMPRCVCSAAVDGVFEEGGEEEETDELVGQVRTLGCRLWLLFPPFAQHTTHYTSYEHHMLAPLTADCSLGAAGGAALADC